MATKRIGVSMILDNPYDDRTTLQAKINRVNSAFIKANQQHHASSCDLSLLLAPEYFFARAELSYAAEFADSNGSQTPLSRPYNMNEYQRVYDAMRYLSARCQEMLIIPGTLMLHDDGFPHRSVRPKQVASFGNSSFLTDPAYKSSLPDMFGEAQDQGGGSPSLHTTSVYNVAPVFYRGKVGLYRKRAPFYELGRPDDISARCAFYQHNPRSNDYVRGRYQYVPGVVPGYFHRGPDGKKCAIGLEICYDHNCGMLRHDLDSGAIGRLDIHLILSASVDLRSDHVCCRNNGLVVHCSSDAHDCQVKRYNRRSMWFNGLTTMKPCKQDARLDLRHWVVELKDA